MLFLATATVLQAYQRRLAIRSGSVEIGKYDVEFLDKRIFRLTNGFQVIRKRPINPSLFSAV